MIPNESADLPQFGIIENIVPRDDNDVNFLVKKMETFEYYPHICAYFARIVKSGLICKVEAANSSDPLINVYKNACYCISKVGI